MFGFKQQRNRRERGAMKNWSALKFALVGLVAGFVLNIIVFADSVFWWPYPEAPFIVRAIPGFLTGITGALVGFFVCWLFTHNRKNVAFGLLSGITFYFIWTVGFRFIFICLASPEGFLFYLPSAPAFSFLGFINQLIRGEEQVGLKSMTVFMWLGFTFSWLFWGFIGTGIGYLLEKKRVRVSK
ncbi:MAG: hypothetical protein QMD08_02790 [Actinomycetota bacterium]|nr:hypothetical protein [Actinomycetota bacterium]